MATRKISDIIADMRAAAADEGKDFATLAEETNKRAMELEAILAKDRADNKFAAIAFTLTILFVLAFAFITNMYNDNLLEDVTQKKEIITKYEQAVRHDTIRTYVDQYGNEITMQSLLDDNMKLMKRISELKSENSMQDILLNDIKTLYGITIVEDKSSYYIEGKKVDSALMLLPYYRDRLSYDSVKKQWIVTHRVVQVGDKTYPE